MSPLQSQALIKDAWNLDLRKVSQQNQGCPYSTAKRLFAADKFDNKRITAKRLFGLAIIRGRKENHAIYQSHIQWIEQGKGVSPVI
ncbi:hypothetical protein ABES25_23400 [Bacillus gobiensis]|uniref:hypothetical protein n=1 Tax=Bacillus gobiensis TaxID=1441095 RepID=UPI003D21A4A3